jgi:uncharacterized protein (DUF488 family)
MNETLFSVGHGRKPVETLIEELKSFGIQYLIDVRSVPYSRFNPQYNQKALNESLEKENITYVFLGDLLGGRPKDESCYVDGKISYELVQQKDFFKRGIERLITANHKNIRAAIMCSESQPGECHRSHLIGTYLAANGIQLKHIVAPGDAIQQGEIPPLKKRKKKEW